GPRFGALLQHRRGDHPILRPGRNAFTAGLTHLPATGTGTEDPLMTAGSPLVDRARLAGLPELERRAFSERNPRSHAMFDQSKKTLLNGVPMSWMSHWPGGYPVFVASAKDASITDVDGHTYVDFCLGDTGAFAGHSPGPTAKAVQAQFARGATTMLPTEDAAWVGTELARRFGLPVWQFSLTATDANRWALRLARWLTGRAKVLVFNGCYHGTVDEAVIRLDQAGRPTPGPGNVGFAIDPTQTTDVLQFNDIQAPDRPPPPRPRPPPAPNPARAPRAGPHHPRRPHPPPPRIPRRAARAHRRHRNLPHHRRNADIPGRTRRLHRQPRPPPRFPDHREGDRGR